MGIIGDQIRDQIKQQIRDQIAANYKAANPPEKTMGGFLSNVVEDVSSLAKGIVGLGHQAIAHPIESSKTVGAVGVELAKQIPKSAVGVAKSMGDIITSPIETTKEAVNAYKELREIPYDVQKKFFDTITEKALQEKERGKRGLGILSSGLTGAFIQEISHPAEYAYEKPFTFALDLLAVGKLAKADKAIAGLVEKIPATNKVKMAMNEAFTPNGKLINAGYDDLARDLTSTKSEIFKVQREIVDDVATKFYKEFKLSKTEQADFFDTIDKMRRAEKGVKAFSANPKIQKAIDWWIDDEVPKLAKMSGLSEENRITNYLHHFFPDKFKKREVYLGTLLQYSKKGYLKKSADVEGFSRDPVVSISAIKSKATIDGLRDNFIKRAIDKYAVKPDDIKSQLINEYGIEYIKKLDDSGQLADFVKSKLGLEEFKPKGNLRFFKQTVEEVVEPPKIAAIKPALKIKQTTKIEQLKQEIMALDDTIKNDPAFNLGKYASRKTGELPEIVGESKSIFAKRGDDIVTESGFKSSEEARVAYDVLTKMKNELNKLKVELKSVKKDTFIDYTPTQLEKINNFMTEVNQIITRKKTFIGVSKNVETHLMPKIIVEELNKFTSPQKGALDKLFIPFDVFNRNWKPLATSVRPRYHTRNVVGNLYNSIVVGGMNPKQIPRALLNQVKHHIHVSIESNNLLGKLYKSIFKEMPDSEIMKMAIDNDIIGRGFFGADLDDLVRAVDKGDDVMKVVKQISKQPASKLEYLEPIHWPILKEYMTLSKKVGEFLENNARLAMFQQGIKKYGGDIVKAKEYVNTHLFDYLTGLGEGDKIIKRFIPFWSWTRFNVPLQMGSVIKTPIRHLALQRSTQPYVSATEKEDEGYQYLSKEQKEAGFLKVGETEKDGKIYDKYIKTASVLPQQDLAKLVNILKGRDEDIGLTPLFQIWNYLTTTPTEVLDYWGKPIERFEGEKTKFLGLSMRGRTKALLSIIPLLTELNKLIGGSYIKNEEPKLSARLETVISPTGLSLQDKEKNKFYYELEKEKELTGSYSAGLESLYKNYFKKDLQYKGAEKYIKKNIEILEEELKKRGLTDIDILKLRNKAIRGLFKDSFQGK